jgi:NAD(P)-dependent dehydrogenase (short-subunit alcohol dehydrogenase family)
MHLPGHVAIITGGASGLGEATARRFSAAGASVAILDMNDAAGALLAAELGAHFEHCDVADATSVEHAVDGAQAALGIARVAVCCAGVGDGSKMIGHRGAHRLDIFQKVMAVNVTGTFHVLREVAWRMRDLEAANEDGERGVLVTTSSIAAFDGVDGGVAYSASKGAVAAMTLPLARDLARHGIRAVSIAPGTFETPMVAGMTDEFRGRLDHDTPFPERMGRPDEYAQLAQHIVENPILNGTVLRLDAGLRMRPSEGWK